MIEAALALTAIVCAYLLGRRVGRIQGAAGAVSWWIEKGHQEASEQQRRMRRADLHLGQVIPDYKHQRENSQWQ